MYRSTGSCVLLLGPCLLLGPRGSWDPGAPMSGSTECGCAQGVHIVHSHILCIVHIVHSVSGVGMCAPAHLPTLLLGWLKIGVREGYLMQAASRNKPPFLHGDVYDDNDDDDDDGGGDYAESDGGSDDEN